MVVNGYTSHAYYVKTVLLKNQFTCFWGNGGGIILPAEFKPCFYPSSAEIL